MPWAKIYTDLIDAHEEKHPHYDALSDVAKCHLHHFWLLAMKSNNRIPHKPEWLQRRLNIREPLELQALLDSGRLYLMDEDDADNDMAMVTEQTLQGLRDEVERLEAENATLRKASKAKGKSDAKAKPKAKPAAKKKKPAAEKALDALSKLRKYIGDGAECPDTPYGDLVAFARAWQERQGKPFATDSVGRDLKEMTRARDIHVKDSPRDYFAAFFAQDGKSFAAASRGFCVAEFLRMLPGQLNKGKLSQASALLDMANAALGK